MEKFAELQQLGTLLADNADFGLWSVWCRNAQEMTEKPPEETLTVSNPDRKWELVSAFQKTVRRGNGGLAARLVSAMASLETEKAYMWRRLCTTATEDVGPANDLLMKFVIACSMVFPPASLQRNQLRGLWGYLAHQMCSSQRSRVYCQYSIIQGMVKGGEGVALMSATPLASRIKHLLTQDLKTDIFLNPQQKWLVKNDWRGEGMLVGPIWAARNPLPLAKYEPVLLVPDTLKGLPDYAYDKHTRVGKGVCFRLCGVSEVKAFFAKYTPKDKAEALGWAMFFEEGGLIANGQHNIHLTAIENAMVAVKHDLPFLAWMQLRAIFRNQLQKGTVNQIREDILATTKY